MSLDAYKPRTDGAKWTHCTQALGWLTQLTWVSPWEALLAAGPADTDSTSKPSCSGQQRWTLEVGLNDLKGPLQPG